MMMVGLQNIINDQELEIEKLRAEIERLNRYDMDLQIFAKENQTLRELVKEADGLLGRAMTFTVDQIIAWREKAKEILG